jgi:hypothetical protein
MVYAFFMDDKSNYWNQMKPEFYIIPSLLAENRMGKEQKHAILTYIFLIST